MIIIGELINGTRKRIKQALAERDADYLAGLARKQDEAGAAFIDVNPGTVGAQEVEDLKWLVQVARSATDKPLSLDTPNAEAIRAALEIYTGPPPLINSISLEQDRWETMLPIVRDAGCNVVALAVSDEGMPCRPGQREAVAFQLVDRLVAEAGLQPSQIFLDPVITPVSTQGDVVTLICDGLRAALDHAPGLHITSGLSNISFGLPNRKLLNRVFLVLAMAAGMDSAIMDPLDTQIMAEVFAAEALLGRDEWCMNYLTAHRAGRLEV